MFIYLIIFNFEKIVYYVNLYAIQNSQTRYKPTNYNEIKRFIGIRFIMGCLKYPRVRLYWENATTVNIIIENMSRDRFFTLRRNFHLIDNTKIPKNNTNKIYKSSSFVRRN